jgi:hypothetical protein
MKSLRLQKNRRIYKILEPTEKQPVPKIWRAPKTRRVLKIPRVPKTRLVRKSRRPYCLGSAGSPAADFLLAWLKSSRSDPRRCDESLMQSPSEETAQAALLLWVISLLYCTGSCTGPPCQEMVKIHAATKNQAAA